MKIKKELMKSLNEYVLGSKLEENYWENIV